MTRPIYCDESIWGPVADGLTQRGWEVHTARGEATVGDPDRQQLQYARDNEWLYLTFDDAFVSLIQRDRLDHAGIIYVKQAGKRISDVVKEVDTYLDGLDDNSRQIHHP